MYSTKHKAANDNLKTTFGIYECPYRTKRFKPSGIGVINMQSGETK